MTWIILSIAGALIALVGWLAYRYGKASAERKASEKQKEEMAADAGVAAKPFVDDPMHGMHS